MNLKLKKNQIVGLSIVATLALAGGAGFFVHNKQVQAQQIALEQKEKVEYDELKLDVNRAIQKAYDTRHEEDITSAENMIQKLKGFLAQVKKTNDLLTKAEKTKADVDIQNAQKSINEEKDEYLSKDKKAHQTRLDKLKKEIADEKAKKEKEAKEKQAQEEQAKQEAVAQAQQAESQQADVQAQETAQAETPQAQASVPEVAQAPTQVAEAPQAQYQAPATQQAVEQAPVQVQPQAPVQAQPSQSTTSDGHGKLTQEELDKAAQEASQQDWSEFFK